MRVTPGGDTETQEDTHHDRRDQAEAKQQVENLELNKETLQDLTEAEGEHAQGGLAARVSGQLTGCPGGSDFVCCKG
jgi:hypothetical protein